MGDSLKNGIIFTAGVALGSVATWFVVKAKYEQIANEEIEDMRIYFDEKLGNAVESNDIQEEEELLEEDVDPVESEPKVAVSNHEHKKPDIMTYKSTIKNEGYTDYSSDEKNHKKMAPGEDPYVITPEEFGEIEGYETVSLTYFAGDDYLAGEDGNLIDDVESKIGWESLSYFGEYEDDAVHVRNDELKTDFEILKDPRAWADIQED